jgi:hypothetical protein
MPLKNNGMKNIIFLIPILFSIASANAQWSGQTSTTDLVSPINRTGMVSIDTYNSAQLRLNGSGANYGKIGNPISQVWSLGWGGTGTDINSVVSWTAAGTVGIGTITPRFTLDVSGNNNVVGVNGLTFLNSVIDANNGYTRSNFGSNVYWDLSTKTWKIAAIGANDFSAIVHPYNDGLAFFTAPNDGNTAKTLTHAQFMTYERMRINANGNVGIGTITPGSYRLAVAGKIAAAGEVRVFNVGTTTFPDYVFAPDYKLPSLEETEKYVKENHHLPEVPSASEIEKDGMSLNEMNVLLLKKVEELTLYMIELKKQNEEIKLRVDGLEKKKD